MADDVKIADVRPGSMWEVYSDGKTVKFAVDGKVVDERPVIEGSRWYVTAGATADSLYLVGHQ